ncbi:trehalose-phosphatase [Pandoraea apista]|uniref:Trehalose 6-phosphate phosphatase n=1 Tax=Pandoraea apista TaxID=93218 RepID=A0ABX9ZPZ8_9BURK|nr:trehalose-phosphatase [Pandoraea apista]PTE00386.1 trehalose-phosphatase [Pandoraea apista]RRJ32994.1 trehalose-phosphatase [Pandoraea apista]RRJ79953.1 trehalose-phosphatase [Pandoraea apista]RSD14688.1 trehalose-phosphatase [Pandoraea apista]RSD19028.1 trehalose-phosphatase [Pandoraea apista]
MQPLASSLNAPSTTTPADTCDVDVATVAFFFDLDGTLAPLASRPDAVRLPRDTASVLARLFERTNGAVAVVSGRAIDDIDGLLAPLRVAAAGLHGAEIRHADGEWVRAEGHALDTARVAEMAAPLRALVAQHPGLLLENKGSALALHYRNAPELVGVARDTMCALADLHADSFALQPGKFVFELRPRHVSKGRAIATLLKEAPFAGRTPLFAGDDLTDEAGFADVNALGGITIKIGEGDTCAHHRLPSPEALTAWLLTLRHTAPRQPSQENGE